jgi:hypothetical protein
MDNKETFERLSKHGWTTEEIENVLNSPNKGEIMSDREKNHTFI